MQYFYSETEKKRNKSYYSSIWLVTQELLSFFDSLELTQSKISLYHI